MILEFQLEKRDYLASLMYQTLKKQKKAHKAILMFFAAALICIGFLPILFQDEQMSTSIFIITGLYLLFSQFYLKPKLLERRFRKYIEDNVPEIFKKNIRISLDNNHIVEETFIGISKFNFEGVKELIEVNNYLFLQLKNGGSIIFPKERINDFELNAFIDKIKAKVDVFHSIEFKRKLSY